MRSKIALRFWAAALAVLVAAASVTAQTAAEGPSPQSTTGSATATDASQAPAGETALPSETRPLPPFSAVTLCAPLNLLVRPGSDYSFTIAAEQPLLSKISADVGADGGLRVTATGPFETNQRVQLTLSMPSDALKSIVHSGPGASLYVYPGFNASATPTNFTTTFGAGQLYVDGLSADTVDVRHGGVGPAVLRGTLQTVTATTSSLAPLYLSGVQHSARLTLGGTASAVVDQAPSSSITGSASGINTVTYSAGSCAINTPFSAFPGFAGSACVQAPFAAPPPPQPVWSCGLRAEGNFTCAAGTLLTQGPGGVASQSVGGQGGAAVQTGTAGTGTASSAASSASSTTSGQGGGSSFVSTTQSTQGGGASGPTTTTTVTRNGQTQTFSGQGTGGTSVAFEGAEGGTASAVSLPCAAPTEATRIQWQ